jgi:hypothetical protein
MYHSVAGILSITLFVRKFFVLHRLNDFPSVGKNLTLIIDNKLGFET